MQVKGRIREKKAFETRLFLCFPRHMRGRTTGFSCLGWRQITNMSIGKPKADYRTIWTQGMIPKTIAYPNREVVYFLEQSPSATMTLSTTFLGTPHFDTHRLYFEKRKKTTGFNVSPGYISYIFISHRVMKDSPGVLSRTSPGSPIFQFSGIPFVRGPPSPAALSDARIV